MIGTTALSSMMAAITNGGSPDDSPYKNEPDFQEMWDALVKDWQGMQARGVTDVELPYDNDPSRE